jgi:hypothetical protein
MMFSTSAPHVDTFPATHTGDGGPVPATNKKANTEYCYQVDTNEEGKVRTEENVGLVPSNIISGYLLSKICLALLNCSSCILPCPTSLGHKDGENLERCVLPQTAWLGVEGLLGGA